MAIKCLLEVILTNMKRTSGMKYTEISSMYVCLLAVICEITKSYYTKVCEKQNIDINIYI